MDTVAAVLMPPPQDPDSSKLAVKDSPRKPSVSASPSPSRAKGHLAAPSTAAISPVPSIIIPADSALEENKGAAQSVPSSVVPIEDPSSAGFSYMVDSLVKQVSLNGIIVAAVFSTWLTYRFIGVFGCILICFGLSYVWQREMNNYKLRVRTELERQQGLKFLISGSESAEWLNLMLARFWLIFEPVIASIVVSSVNPILEYYTPAFLDSISLAEFTLGTNAPRITAFRAVPNTANDIIRFDFDAVFQPKDSSDLSLRKGERNSRIVLKTRVGKGMVGVDIPVLVTEMGFAGTISIEITTMGGFPYAKIVSISFPTHPKIDFVLKPLNGMDIMDTPGLSNFLHKLIQDVMGWLFIAPNAFVLDLDQMMNGDFLNVESATGVLMINMFEAKGLKNVETIGNSDPYAVVKIGGKKVAATRAINDNLNPYWNETFYVLVNSLKDSFEISVLDEDILKDRSLGNFKASLSDFSLETQQKHEDVWKPLRTSRDNEKVKTKGEVRFELHYYPVPTPPEVPDSPSGILRVTIHQAKELDESKSISGLYNPWTEVFQNGVKIHQTKVKKRTLNPQWEDIFQVLIRESNFDVLKFVVRDQRDLAADPELGDIEITAKDIINMLLPTVQKVEWWTLRNTNSGKLRLSFSYTPVAFDHILPPLSTSGKISLPPAIGVVRFKIAEAMGLQNFEAVGLSDPYVEVMYAGKRRYRSLFVNDSLDPLWNEFCYILIQDSSLKGKVQFNLYDFNQMSKDKFMGSASFDLKTLLDATEHGPSAAVPKASWLPIILEKKNRGKLLIEASYHSMVKPKEVLPPVQANPEAGIPVAEPKPLSPTEIYNCGIIRVEVHEAELDSDALVVDGYTEKKRPSPYFEFFDVSNSLSSNETATLVEIPKSQYGVPAKDRNQAINLTNTSVSKLDKNLVYENVNMLYRSAAQKNTFSATYNEAPEFFVKDIHSARLLVVLKDHVVNVNNKQQQEGDDIKVQQRADRDPTIAKIDLDVATLIDFAHNKKFEQQKEDGAKINEWFQFFSLNPHIKSAAGKFRLTVTFTPVEFDEAIMEMEQDLESTDAGTFAVTLFEAHNLPAVDSSGTSDPYCNFKLNGDKIHKSKVQKKNNINPKWNESFEHKISRRTNSRFIVECRDWNQFDDNKLLGLITIDCSQIEIETAVDKEFGLVDEAGKEVVGPNGARSTLHMKYFFTPDESAKSKRRRRRDRLNNRIHSVGGALGSIGALNVAAKKLLGGRKNQASVGGIAVAAAAVKSGGALPQADPQAVQKATTANGFAGLDPAVATPIVSGQNSSTDALSVAEQVGSLSVTIVSGKNLKAVDAGGTSDPYVKVRHTSITKNPKGTVKKEHVLHKTKVINKNLNPVWMEKFHVPFELHPNSDEAVILTFSIKDHNNFGTSIEMGEIDINVMDLLKKSGNKLNEAFTMAYETATGDLKGGADGILSLSFEYSPDFVPRTSGDSKMRAFGGSASSLLQSDGESISGKEKTSLFKLKK